MPSYTACILLVDDSEDDRLLMIRSLEKADPPAEVISIENGAAALAFIEERAASQVPTLILLDLNMANVDGFEVLSKIRANATTKTLPVVIMTTSDEEGDIRRCYELGANSYVRKPVNSAEFSDVIAQLKAYWLSTNLAIVDDPDVD